MITIFGPVNNSTMKIDHFQLGSLKRFNSVIVFLISKVGQTLWERLGGERKIQISRRLFLCGNKGQFAYCITYPFCMILV